MGDNENFYNVLDNSPFDISTMSELATIIDAEGKSVSNTLKNITNRYNELLETMSEEEAYTTIFSELAAETNNADRRMELFNLGLQRGLQKTAQDADQLNNTLKKYERRTKQILKRWFGSRRIKWIFRNSFNFN